MKINSSNVIKILEGFSPEIYAQDWDNVGFQIGNINRKIDKIMVVLEVTPQIVEEAIDESVDLIISHHPLIFKPLNRIVASEPVGQMILQMIQNNINLIVSHTNLDASPIGLNAYLAKNIGLKRITNLSDAYTVKYVKFVIYVPRDCQEKMVEVLEEAGAGAIGNYSGCTFNTSGTGTFRPLKDSNPSIGEIGAFEKVDEVRIETIVEEKNLKELIRKAVKVHPYETPAYDIIPLMNEFENPAMGLIGYLNESMTLKSFAFELKDILNSQSMRIIEAGNRKISKVALCTGASSEFISVASKSGADVFITGDIKYHEAQYAKQLGLHVIDAGHYDTEQFYIEEFERILRQRFEAADYEVAIIRSKIDINPFQTI